MSAAVIVQNTKENLAAFFAGTKKNVVEPARMTRQCADRRQILKKKGARLMKHKKQKIIIKRKNGMIICKGNVDVTADINFLNLVAMKVRLGEVELTTGAKLRRFLKRLRKSVRRSIETFDKRCFGAIAANEDSGFFIPGFLLVGEEDAGYDPRN